MTHSPDAPRQDWLNRVNAVLKGNAFDADAALQGRIAGPRAARAAHAPWKILCRVDGDSVAFAQRQAKEDIALGADGVCVASVKLVPALADLPLHKIHVRNEASEAGAEALRKLIGALPLDPARLQIDFACPTAAQAITLAAQGYSGPFMQADGRVFHGQGYSDAQEIGLALAQAVSHLRALDGLSDTQLAKAVSITLAAHQQMFATLAKFRAVRILWRQMLAASKLPDAPLALHGETSRLMIASVDAHSNILRAVAAAFGAGLGGADTFCALPFSQAQGVPNSFARRVSRNLQYILLHESHLWRADDPAAGAGAVERQTQHFCEQAWTVFQSVERGEMPVADGGTSPATPIIGVSKYMNASDHAAEIEAVS